MPLALTPSSPGSIPAVPDPKFTVAVLLSRIAAVMSVFCNLLLVTLPGSRYWPVLRNPPPLPQMMWGTLIPLWLGPSAMWKVIMTWALSLEAPGGERVQPLRQGLHAHDVDLVVRLLGGRVVADGPSPT